MRLREVASLNVSIKQKKTKILNMEQFFRIHSCETIVRYLYASLSFIRIEH